ncbi:hypothetical protein C5167_019225 [Papaver somniferum]|uniref:CTLH domain-containing protein n=1 Tax=Papaver somniferum TaxID=3469 RepID=A0A4Y7IQ63_PAPSO|nr:hypothetical protein C5167_019225 [Papaver somniferum]
MSTSKRVITREEWEKKLNEVKIRKEDMNKLVMNYLVTEGYVEAAERFKMESGTEPLVDLASITERMAVKKALHCGDIEDAIEKVNDLNPEILDTNPQLFFLLQQQKLIELIRNGKTEEALEFAQEELAPRGEENVTNILLIYMFVVALCLKSNNPKLPSLLKMLVWAQSQLDEKALYPHIKDLSTGVLEDHSASKK